MIRDRYAAPCPALNRALARSDHVRRCVRLRRSRAGPALFTDGGTSSGLSYIFTLLASGTTDDLDFSDDDAASWTYTPIDSGDGTDPSVTHARMTPSGAFNGNAGSAPQASYSYEVVLF